MSLNYSFDPESRLYDLNRHDKDAIYEIDAFEHIVRHTSDEFESEEEFRRIKEWSDKNYCLMYSGQRKERKHTLSFDWLDETEKSVDSPEDLLSRDTLEKEKDQLIAHVISLSKVLLTDIQRKRFTMFINGMTISEIALEEGTSVFAIYHSIDTAKQIIKKHIFYEQF